MSTDQSGFDFEMINPEEDTELETREVAKHCCHHCGYVNND
ncbi:hypothetical protein ACMHYB_06045 [Sorangium sp. So ce1128]